MATYDPQTQRYPRIPSWIVLDDEGRGTYPLCSPTFNVGGLSFEYTPENLRALEDRIVRQAGTIDEVAREIGADSAVLESTVSRWNALVGGRRGRRPRPPASFHAFHQDAAIPLRPVWPICSNTHGGPVHDAKQRVIDAWGEPIPRLYAAGELGGVFGHLYLAGGNMAECFIGRVDRGPRGRRARTMGMNRERRRQ